MSDTITWRPCSECGKKFRSLKALFGHMRCHPDRQWRGMNPPPNFRRRRSPPAPEPAATEEDHEVANCLLMLAGGLTNTDSPSACAVPNEEILEVSDAKENAVIDGVGLSPTRVSCSEKKEASTSASEISGLSPTRVFCREKEASTSASESEISGSSPTRVSLDLNYPAQVLVQDVALSYSSSSEMRLGF